MEPWINLYRASHSLKPGESTGTDDRIDKQY